MVWMQRACAFALVVQSLWLGGCTDPAAAGRNATAGGGVPGVTAGAGGGGGLATGASAGNAGTGGGLPLPADDVPVDFFRDIQPILGDYCVRCHGGVRELGMPALNLQSRDKAAFTLGQPGNPNASLLYIKVSIDDPELRMPLGQPALPADKLNKLRRWIFQGAPWPTQWSFAPLAVVDPTSLPVSNEAWVKTPLDRFVLNRLDQTKITPSAEAAKVTLIRRVALDLVGLPPTPTEVDAFVADTAVTAYETVVDRLLASPAFGERWARHWLDQARYADSDGYEKDNGRKSAWRYRDWVIDSLNADQPFDQFTIDQLAGDLEPNATPLSRLGTGFSRNTLRNDEDGADPEEDRTKRVLDRAATVGTAWLGLTLGCTQCHSHPYDPIKQQEFYRMYAFFDNADEVTTDVPNGADTLTADVLSERGNNRRKTYLFTRGDFLNPDKSSELQGGTPAVLPPMAARGATPDRLDLARWLVDAKNPLTPRVFVNTTWYHLFGQGLVTSLEDFGSRAIYPSHPEMLDWLASTFVSGGFSRKKLIRQIVLSATYRQASATRPDIVSDLENTLLYRQNRVRVEAEIVSDAFLAVSGLLSTKRGGPCVYPRIPPEILDITYNGIDWPTSTGEDAHRRGLYTWHQRTQLYPSLAGFDRPNASVSVTGRDRSNTPLQPLITLHDPVYVEATQAFAKRVQEGASTGLHDQVTLAFRLAVARAPSAEESAELEKLYADAKATFTAAPDAAKAAVGKFQPQGVAMADAAAWVATARIVLNLDEFITRE
jgi:Protein of unknown function (DUF1549)/Protein of unknown function (DUF1553)/Planctomycete cytochrome C